MKESGNKLDLSTVCATFNMECYVLARVTTGNLTSTMEALISATAAFKAFMSADPHALASITKTCGWMSKMWPNLDCTRSMAKSAAAEVDSPEGDFLTATAMSACVPTMSTFAGRFDLPPSSVVM